MSSKMKSRKIMHSCGHESVQFCTEWQADQRESKLCPDCWKAEQNAEAVKFSKEHNLPELTGNSEKQVSYANTVRMCQLQKANADYDDSKDDPWVYIERFGYEGHKHELSLAFRAAMHIIDLEDTIDFLKTCTSAGEILNTVRPAVGMTDIKVFKKILEFCNPGLAGKILTVLKTDLTADILVDVQPMFEAVAKGVTPDVTPYDKKTIFKEAWKIAKAAAATFGGSSKEYLSEALKEAWRTVKCQK